MQEIICTNTYKVEFLLKNPLILDFSPTTNELDGWLVWVATLPSALLAGAISNMTVPWTTLELSHLLPSNLIRFPTSLQPFLSTQGPHTSTLVGPLFLPAHSHWTLISLYLYFISSSTEDYLATSLITASSFPWTSSLFTVPWPIGWASEPHASSKNRDRLCFLLIPHTFFKSKV